MGNIPESQWVLEPKYFRARLVQGFVDKYIAWTIGKNFYGSVEVFKSYSEAYNLRETLENMYGQEGLVLLYQYTQDNVEEYEADYFEKEDDNFVIPRHLFEVL